MTDSIYSIPYQVRYYPGLPSTNFSVAKWEYGGLNMVDWGLADNPCIPTALVNDKYFPLLGSDPTLTAGPNRGS